MNADKGQSVDDRSKGLNETLNKYLTSAPKFEGDIHRGMVVEKSDLGKVLQQYKPGNTINSETKQSWTKDAGSVDSRLTQVARDKEDPVKVFLHYPDSKAAVDVSAHSSFPEEQEAVMPKGASYRVKAVSQQGGEVHITMENGSGVTAAEARLTLARSKRSAAPKPARLQFQASGNNTCDDCWALDGKVFDEDDPDLPDLPLHPHCECELVSYRGR